MLTRVYVLLAGFGNEHGNNSIECQNIADVFTYSNKTQQAHQLSRYLSVFKSYDDDLQTVTLLLLNVSCLQKVCVYVTIKFIMFVQFYTSICISHIKQYVETAISPLCSKLFRNEYFAAVYSAKQKHVLCYMNDNNSGNRKRGNSGSSRAGRRRSSDDRVNSLGSVNELGLPPRSPASLAATGLPYQRAPLTGLARGRFMTSRHGASSRISNDGSSRAMDNSSTYVANPIYSSRYCQPQSPDGNTNELMPPPVPKKSPRFHANVQGQSRSVSRSRNNQLRVPSSDALYTANAQAHNMQRVSPSSRQVDIQRTRRDSSGLERQPQAILPHSNSSSSVTVPTTYPTHTGFGSLVSESASRQRSSSRDSQQFSSWRNLHVSAHSIQNFDRSSQWQLHRGSSSQTNLNPSSPLPANMPRGHSQSRLHYSSSQSSLQHGIFQSDELINAFRRLGLPSQSEWLHGSAESPGYDGRSDRSRQSSQSSSRQSLWTPSGRSSANMPLSSPYTPGRYPSIPETDNTFKYDKESIRKYKKHKSPVSKYSSSHSAKYTSPSNKQRSVTSPLSKGSIPRIELSFPDDNSHLEGAVGYSSNYDPFSLSPVTPPVRSTTVGPRKPRRARDTGRQRNESESLRRNYPSPSAEHLREVNDSANLTMSPERRENYSSYSTSQNRLYADSTHYDSRSRLNTNDQTTPKSRLGSYSQSDDNVFVSPAQGYSTGVFDGHVNTQVSNPVSLDSQRVHHGEPPSTTTPGSFSSREDVFKFDQPTNFGSSNFYLSGDPQLQRTRRKHGSSFSPERFGGCAPQQGDSHSSDINRHERRRLDYLNADASVHLESSPSPYISSHQSETPGHESSYSHGSSAFQRYDSVPESVSGAQVDDYGDNVAPSQEAIGATGGQRESDGSSDEDVANISTDGASVGCFNPVNRDNTSKGNQKTVKKKKSFFKNVLKTFSHHSIDADLRTIRRSIGLNNDTTSVQPLGSLSHSSLFQNPFTANFFRKSNKNPRKTEQEQENQQREQQEGQDTSDGMSGHVSREESFNRRSRLSQSARESLTERRNHRRQRSVEVEAHYDTPAHMPSDLQDNAQSMTHATTGQEDEATSQNPASSQDNSPRFHTPPTYGHITRRQQ